MSDTVPAVEAGRDRRRGWWRPAAWIVVVGLFAVPPVPAPLAAAVVGVGALAALAAERPVDTRWRLALLSVTALSGVGATVLSPTTGSAPVPIFIAAVSLARLVPWRRTVLAGGLLLGVLFSLAVLYISGTPWGLFAGVGVPLIAARSWGREALRREHARTVALVAELEARRDADRRAAAADERARIARDLHDVLAHTLSGLSLQLQGVRAVLARRPDTPETVTASLDRAAELARDGLGEAKRAVAALREAPAPDASQLTRLVAEHPDTRPELGEGFEAGFDELDPAVRETALATVRESLTNVRRHAPGATVRVILDVAPGGDLTVAVEDDGPQQPVTAADDGSGVGLRGLAERAALVGGTIDTRAHDRGWSVRLSVPAPVPVRVSVTVVLADDQAVVRDGLTLLLSASDDLEVVDAAADGPSAVAAILAARPQVALVDLRMPGLDGAQVTARVGAEAPEVRVLVLTTYADDDAVLPALRAGAAGYLTKDTSGEALLAAIRTVAAGGSVLDAGVQRRLVELTASPATTSPSEVPDPDITAGLTSREIDVLRLVAQGLSNQRVASSLVVSEATVKTHVNHLLSKLVLDGRPALVAWAWRHGLT